MSNQPRTVVLPSLTANMWHGGDPVRARQSLLAAFDVGQLLNQFVWHLGQAAVLAGPEHEELLAKALCELSGKVLQMTPTLDAGVRLQAVALECLRTWQNMRDSEWFAEDFDKALRSLQQHPADPEDDPLQDMLFHVESLHRRIRIPLDSKTAPFPELGAALLLGERIDQGLRPPGVLRHVFREEKNPEWWGTMRRDPTLRVQVDPLAMPTSTRTLPRRLVPVRRTRLPGELRPPDAWANTIKGLWHRLGLQAELPKKLFLLLERRSLLALPGVVRQVKSAAREGLARLAESLTGSTRHDDASPSSPIVLPLPAGTGRDESVAVSPACAGPASDETVSGDEFDRLLAIKKEVDTRGEYIGESLAILRVFEAIELYNRTPDKPVVILGPTGAGKTDIARLIHEHSGRCGKPFVEEQASDFHGKDFHITKSRWAGIGTQSGLPDLKHGGPGRLREAAGGTIFIDELAEVPLEFQTFLLRVLDGKEIPPAAGVGPALQPDVRLLFATNVEPADAVKTGKLRADLFRRLRAWTIRIPPLGARKEDIFLFIQACCGQHPPSPHFLLCLLRHSWPGNVGELHDVLATAVAKTSRSKEQLTLDHLSSSLPSIVQEVRKLKDTEVEKEVYQQLAGMLQRQGLRKGDGLYKRMGEILQVSPATVTRRATTYLPDSP